MRVRRFDALIIKGIGLDHLEAESFIKLYGAVVVHLDMTGREVGEIICVSDWALVIYSQEYAVKVAILFHIVQDMIDHDRADSEPAIGIQTAQGHNI